jgi:phosphoribosylaminoimidazole-succinocarboxamide synthase
VRIIGELPDQDNKEIFLGDQSPLVGGLLRLVCATTASQQINDLITASYLHQNADNPFVSVGAPNVKIKGGYVPYFNTAGRNPFSPSGFQKEENGLMNSFRQYLEAPPGLMYLTGSKTNTTFYSLELADSNPEGMPSHITGLVEPVRELSKKILLAQIEWGRQIAQWSEYEEGEKIAQEMRKIVENSTAPHIGGHSFNIYEEVFGKPRELGSVIETFQQPKSLEPFLDGSTDLDVGEYFWVIDLETGTRRAATREDLKNSSKIAIVPKGVMLPIEIALRGYTLGFTGMSYAKKVEELRAKLFPKLQELQELQELKIPIMQFEFEMEYPEAMDKKLRDFIEKRKDKGKPVNEEILQEAHYQANKAWEGRPTLLFALITGVPISVTMHYYEDISKYIKYIESMNTERPSDLNHREQ